MSNQVKPACKEFVEWILAYETASNPGDSRSAVFHVCEKLRQSLGKLLGVGGFRALLSRALALAGAEVPWLRAVQIKADGSLEGMDALEAKLGATEIAQGHVALLAQVFALLVTFIGPSLTLELIQDAWPKAKFERLEF
jgi:hypothetical protein